MGYDMHWLQPYDEQRSRLDTTVWRGVNNGLPATRWVPILDVTVDDVMALLATLAIHGIAAHADITGRPVGPRTTQRPRWRIWVGATAHARAEDVLRLELSTCGASRGSKMGDP
jgi:hypothetical protein